MNDIIIDYKKQLNISLSSNITTKTLSCVCTWTTIGSTVLTIFRTTLSNDIPKVIIPTPIINNDRQLNYLKVTNYDSVSAMVLINVGNVDTIGYNMNIISVLLSPNEILSYNIKDGFYIIDYRGKIKNIQNTIEITSIPINTGTTTNSILDYYTKPQTNSLLLQKSNTGHTHSQYLTGLTINYSLINLSGITHVLSGYTRGWVTGLDAFGRSQQNFRGQNSILTLGGWQADGSSTISSEGAVFYGVNAKGILSDAEGGYARIKPNRFGLGNIITGIDGSNLFYYFRVDDIELYLKDNNNIKTFAVDRASGVVSANMFRGDIDWNYVTTKPDFLSSYGSLYEHNSTGTTITVSNTETKGWITASSSSNHLTTLTKNITSDRISILSGGSGTYQINVNINNSYSNNTPLYWMGIYKNNNLITQLQTYLSATNTNDRYNSSINSIISSVSVGDFFDIRFNSNNPTPSNIIIYNISFNMNRIGT